VNLQSLLEATTLLGWSIEDIDRLSSLERQAGEDALTIADWREQDAALRSQLPPPDATELRAATEVAQDADRQYGYRDNATRTLVNRLHTISTPAPTDDDLRRQLLLLVSYANDPALRDAIAEDRRRIIGWLQHSKDLDPETKLPWSTIAQFRIIDDPQLGPAPQSVYAARRNALDAATTDQLEQARSLDGGRVDQLASAISEVTTSQLTFFPKMVLDDDTAPERAALVHQLWRHPATQEALRRETANGWPPEYI
jgi:hypothetical protein